MRFCIAIDRGFLFGVAFGVMVRMAVEREALKKWTEDQKKSEKVPEETT